MKRAAQFLENPRAIYVVVALFIALGALYSITTPLFEAGDELWHYPYVQWIARGNGLPIQDPAREQLWEQEGGQPPLYYVTSAALTFWIDTGDLPERLWRNPYAKIGVPLAYGNKNMIVHTNAENFPWQNTALAVHLIRFISVLFGAGTVLLTYKIARELSLAPSRARSISPALSLFAACIVAFNPMFLFISASVNNDSLAALLATAAMLLMIQLVTRGATNWRVFILGIIVALAILTKVSNLALGIVAVTVLAYCAWKQKSFRFLIRAGILFLVPILVLDAWWFARNYFLYGDVTAFNVWLEIAGGRPPQTLLGLLDEFQGLRISFWGNFGGVNVIAPDWVYRILDIFTLLAVLGLGIGVLFRGNHKGLPLPSLLWIPALQLLVVFVALIRWTLLTYASQGRLLFPAIVSIAILFAFGLFQITDVILRLTTRLTPHAARLSPFVLLFAFAIFLFTFSISAPFFLIAPAYAQPVRLSDEARVPNPVHIKFDAGDAQPELVGYDVPRFLQGNELPLKLYWRSDARTTRDLAMYIHIYDARGELIGQWDAFTGNGLLPTRLWQPNEIFEDEYRVPIRGDVALQQSARVEVGLAKLGAARPLIARDPQGQEITPIIASVGIPAAKQNDIAPARFIFGNELDVTAIGFVFERGITQGQIAPMNAPGAVSPLAPGDVIRAKYILRARREHLKNFTLFAQLVDAQGKVISQYDSPPRQNAYPTSYWRAGESVSDSFTFTVPADATPGMYALLFGVYGSEDKMRLSVRGETFEFIHADGDHLVIAPIEIAP